MNGPVSPERYARDIELLARRGRIMQILSTGEDVTVGQLGDELSMSHYDVRVVLASLFEDGLVKADFEPDIETWRFAGNDR